MATINSSSKSISANLLRLINECDNFPYAPSISHSEAVSGTWLFLLLSDWTPECTTLTTCGYIPTFVIEGMPWTSSFVLDNKARTVTIPYHADKTESQIIAELLDVAREKKSFKVLSGWRDELYPILHIKGRLVNVERAASCLFGMATRGVHCTAYTYVYKSNTTSTLQQDQRSKNQLPHLIIPRRASSKSTYPSMLDNTIAGGISSKETPWLAHLRESGEEAGLPPSVAARAIPTGTISYMHIRDARAGGETGLYQPETQFCYDLELFDTGIPSDDKETESGTGTASETPQVNDDEVASFEYMTFQQAWEALLGDEFKPNCGLVLIDFFVRWGFIRAGKDEWIDSTAGDASKDIADAHKLVQREGFEVPPDMYNEIVARMHRKMVFEDISARA